MYGSYETSPRSQDIGHTEKEGCLFGIIFL